MTETISALQPYIAALNSGDRLPPFAPRELGFGSPDDAAAAVVFLASDAAAGVSGQVLGIGADRLALWAHPAEQAVAFHDGGWDAASIAAAWPQEFAPHEQPVGQHFPEPPQ
jgi:NAD(P)-dependent dehydrogenase (short-subunit alcohol dehydrogenase family)